MRRHLFGMKRSVERSSAPAVYAVLVVQSFMASGTHLVAKVVVESVDAFTLTLVRGRGLSVRRQDYGLITGLAFLAIPINQFLFLLGIRYTIPSNAALLYATTPILVLLFSRWFLSERLTKQKLLGVALGFIGVAIVIFERGVDASRQYVVGNLIIYVAVIAWGLYTVYGKRLIAVYGPIQASSMTLILGTVMVLPLGVIPAISFPFETLTTANWLQIAYLGLVTSVLAYLLWYYALGRVEAGKVALFANLQPILTTVLAVVLLGQDVTLAFVIGGTVAITGVVIAQFG